MGEFAVEVDNLSKLYRIGKRRTYKTARESLMSVATLPGRKIRGLFGPSTADEADQSATQLWALKDVSFTVKPGEVVGIIGRNGAGKSTLLKVLSRITEPTAGRVRIHGRVGSLLEVGTGFHPELTGRENVFLNGAILGMKRHEITRQFDAIVDFAGVDRFIDTPVKHYSSGMYTRLAFAVAAHLEPEILIVDEVLAVGDAEFQKKCMGKMRDVAGEGRTVLFVSHNMNAVQELCTTAVHLESGTVKSRGPAGPLVDRYLFDPDQTGTATEWCASAADRPTSASITPNRFALVDAAGHVAPPTIRNDGDYWLTAEVEVTAADPAMNVGYAVYSEEGRTLFWSFVHDGPEHTWPALSSGRHVLRTKWPARFLNEGVYRVELLAALHFREWLLASGKNAPAINVTIHGGLSDSPHFFSKREGLLAPVFPWESGH